jgi:hypothetical protein
MIIVFQFLMLYLSIVLCINGIINISLCAYAGRNESNFASFMFPDCLWYSGLFQISY